MRFGGWVWVGFLEAERRDTSIELIQSHARETSFLFEIRFVSELLEAGLTATDEYAAARVLHSRHPRAASAAMCPAKAVTNVFRLVSSESSTNSPVLTAARGEARTVAVV